MHIWNNYDTIMIFLIHIFNLLYITFITFADLNVGTWWFEAQAQIRIW